MRPWRAARAGAALVAALAAAGCYRYHPAAATSAAAGSHATLALSESGTALLAPAVGPRAVRLEGRVVSAEPSAVTMAVSTIVREPFQEESWPRESVRVPMTAVRQLQVRRLDAKRSALVAGLAAASLFATRAVIDANSGGGGGRSSGGQTGQ